MRNRFLFLEKELYHYNVENRERKQKKLVKRKSGFYRKPIVDSFSNTSYTEQLTLPSSGLTWTGATSEQLIFMKAVYDLNLARSSRRGTFVNDVPSNQLATVEGRYKLRTAAAQDAIAMFQAARTAINAANVNASIGLTSAYRSASHQFSLWNRCFINKYYPDTQSHRRGLSGGEHGQDAINYLARYMRTKIATPGYSNHNNGLAIDIRNTENGNTYRNSTRKSATDAWKKSWLWSWLTANAATHKFYQNTHINEPWHWEYRP